jgi:hypothetical protein
MRPGAHTTEVVNALGTAVVVYDAAKADDVTAPAAFGMAALIMVNQARLDLRIACQVLKAELDRTQR